MRSVDSVGEITVQLRYATIVLILRSLPPLYLCCCQGSFRRSCEETMRVLRLNSEMLLTVLEVFLVDPLYKVRCDQVNETFK